VSKKQLMMEAATTKKTAMDGPMPTEEDLIKVLKDMEKEFELRIDSFLVTYRAG